MNIVGLCGHRAGLKLKVVATSPANSFRQLVGALGTLENLRVLNYEEYKETQASIIDEFRILI